MLPAMTYVDLSWSRTVHGAMAVLIQRIEWIHVIVEMFPVYCHKVDKLST